MDERCNDALDLLVSKRLPAEGKYYVLLKKRAVAFPRRLGWNEQKEDERVCNDRGIVCFEESGEVEILRILPSLL